MARLSDYEIFLAILDAGSLTAAARRLDRSLQSVSRSLASLEAELGVGLVRRTTRRLHPTPAGLAFGARLRGAMAQIADARDDLVRSGAELTGLIRVAASTIFAPAHLVPVAVGFQQQHPRVGIELVLADAFEDLVASDLDLAVRIGVLSDSGLRARRLGALRRVIFASPGYLEHRGRPRTPDDLTRHRCVIRTGVANPTHWTFRESGRSRIVDVSGSFSSTSAAACNEAVVLGAGIGVAPLWQIGALVEGGRVELVLNDYEPEPAPVHAVWSPTPQLPARTRAFIDHLARGLASWPGWTA
ncbi:LysR family transcriptional regulator [Enterovirga rhinocerotis]|uniref:LysR family transcriptional regulator n=1 Tax=Enterovirga rhinocerotis TaxID=1339210 RepID=A0A4R7BNT6_9HYPH|nr:LysR family transcriptional regulator [Enterovirga rhinocerotis]TDR87168.1 LysR family transcriptional regulator [Enterovirga rhinocerotis]